MIDFHQKRWKFSDYPCEGCPPPPKLKEQAPIIHPIVTKYEELMGHQKVAVSSIKKVISNHVKDFKMNLHGSQVKGYWTEKSDYDLVVHAKVDEEIQKILIDYDYGYIVNISFTDTEHRLFPQSIEII